MSSAHSKQLQNFLFIGNEYMTGGLERAVKGSEGVSKRKEKKCELKRYTSDRRDQSSEEAREKNTNGKRDKSR